MLLLRGSDKSDLFRKKSSRMEIWTRLVNTFIFCLIGSRLILCLLTPPELMPFSYLSAEIIHLLLTGLIFSVLWALIWYFGSLKSEIKIEERSTFAQQLLNFIVVLGVTDLLITLLLGFQGYRHMFTIQVGWHSPEIGGLSADFLPLLVMLLILIILLIVLYTLYIFKRSLKILKQYWLTLLLLMIIAVLFAFLQGTDDLGWYEDGQARLLIFSWQYVYFGWIYLLFMSISVFCNTASIVLLSITNKFVNPVKFKNLSITFIKMGFISGLAFAFLSMIPQFLLWLYT